MNLIKAFTLEQAARVAKVSPRRVAYWARREVLTPTLLYDPSSHPRRYLYTFADVVGLRVLGVLRDKHNLSLQQLRKATVHLREHAERPWSELRFWVMGRELFFTDPRSGVIVSTKRGHQAVFPIDLEPVAIGAAEDAAILRARQPDDIGKTERRRNVQGNREVVRGTRVPVQSIINLAEDGYDAQEIVRAFPSLTLDDVQAVLAVRRRSPAA